MPSKIFETQKPQNGQKGEEQAGSGSFAANASRNSGATTLRLPHGLRTHSERPQRLPLQAVLSAGASNYFDGSGIVSEPMKDRSLSGVRKILREALAQLETEQEALSNGIRSKDSIAYTAQLKIQHARVSDTLEAIEKHGERVFLPDIVAELLPENLSPAQRQNTLNQCNERYDASHDDILLPGLSDVLSSASLLDVAHALERIGGTEGAGGLSEAQKAFCLEAVLSGNEQQVFALEEAVVTQLIGEGVSRHLPLQVQKEEALERLESLEQRADALKTSTETAANEQDQRAQDALRVEIAEAAKLSAEQEQFSRAEEYNLRALQQELVLARAERFAIEHPGQIDTELLRSLSSLPRESWNHSPRLRELWASSVGKLDGAAGRNFSEVEKLQLSKGDDAALAHALEQYETSRKRGDLLRQAEAGVELNEYSEKLDPHIREQLGEKYQQSLLPGDPQVRTKEFIRSSYAQLQRDLGKLLYVETEKGKGRFVLADNRVRERIENAPPGYHAVLSRLPEGVEFTRILLGERQISFSDGTHQSQLIVDSSVLAPDLSDDAKLQRARLRTTDIVYVALERGEQGRTLHVDNGFGQGSYTEEELAHERAAGEQLSALIHSLGETQEALGRGLYLYKRHVALAEKLQNGMAENTKKAEWVAGVRASAAELEELYQSQNLSHVQRDLQSLAEKLGSLPEGLTTNQHDQQIAYIQKLSAELSRITEQREIEQVCDFIQSPDFDPDTWGKWCRTQGVRIGATLAGATALASIPATMGASTPLAVAILSGVGAYAGGEIGSAALSLDYRSYESKLQRFAKGEMSLGEYVVESGLEIGYAAATTYVLGAAGRSLGNASRGALATSSSFGAKELGALAVVRSANAFEQLEKGLARAIPGARNYGAVWAREFVEEVVEEGAQGGLAASGALIEEENFVLGQALKAASSSIALLSGARGHSRASLESGGVTLESLPDARTFIEEGVLETRFAYDDGQVTGLLNSLRAQGVDFKHNKDTGEIRVDRGVVELDEAGAMARQVEVYAVSAVPSFVRELQKSSVRPDGSSMLGDCGFTVSESGELSISREHTETGVSLVKYLRRQGISVSEAGEQLRLAKGDERAEVRFVGRAEDRRAAEPEYNASTGPSPPPIGGTEAEAELQQLVLPPASMRSQVDAPPSTTRDTESNIEAENQSAKDERALSEEATQEVRQFAQEVIGEIEAAAKRGDELDFLDISDTLAAISGNREEHRYTSAHQEAAEVFLEQLAVYCESLEQTASPSERGQLHAALERVLFSSSDTVFTMLPLDRAMSVGARFTRIPSVQSWFGTHLVRELTYRFGFSSDGIAQPLVERISRQPISEQLDIVHMLQTVAAQGAGEGSYGFRAADHSKRIVELLAERASSPLVGMLSESVLERMDQENHEPSLGMFVQAGASEGSARLYEKFSQDQIAEHNRLVAQLDIGEERGVLLSIAQDAVAIFDHSGLPRKIAKVDFGSLPVPLVRSPHAFGRAQARLEQVHTAEDLGEAAMEVLKALEPELSEAAAHGITRDAYLAEQFPALSAAQWSRFLFATQRRASVRDGLKDEKQRDYNATVQQCEQRSTEFVSQFEALAPRIALELGNRASLVDRAVEQYQHAKSEDLPERQYEAAESLADSCRMLRDFGRIDAEANPATFELADALMQVRSAHADAWRQFHRRDQARNSTPEVNEVVAEVREHYLALASELGPLANQLEQEMAERAVGARAKLHPVEVLSVEDIAADPSLCPFPMKDARELSLLLMHLQHAPLRQALERDLGVSLSGLPLRSQVHLLRYLASQDASGHGELSAVLSSEKLSDNAELKTKILSSFLATSEKPRFAKAILSIAERLPVEQAESIFSKYLELTAATAEARSVIQAAVGEQASQHQVNDVSKKLLYWANRTLEHSAKNLSEDPEATKRLVERLDTYRKDVFLLGVTYKTLRSELSSAEAIEGVQVVERTPSQLSAEQLQRIRDTYQMNCERMYGDAHTQKVIEAHDAAMSEPGTRLYLMEYKGKLVSFLRADQVEPDVVHIGAFNASPDSDTFAIGSALLRAALNRENRRNAIIGEVHATNPILATYTTRYGFREVGREQNWEGTGAEVVHIRREATNADEQ